MNSPCLNCPDRHKLCHSTCERYKEFRKTLDIIQKEKDKNMEEIRFAAAIAENVAKRFSNKKSKFHTFK